MNWEKDFYKKQFLWSKEFIDYDMETLNFDLVSKFESFCGNNSKKILELGGGNGQFAVAAAKKGYEVTVIEIVPECVDHIYKLKEKFNITDNLRVIEGDFYKVQIDDQFDVVCYWDGFGIGSDSEQQVLLQNVSNWLKPDGVALLDVYTPWYWAKVAGQEMNFGKIQRQYNFNAEECRMLDTWWLRDDLNKSITQSLRCYSPADLSLLLRNLNLKLVHCESGGSFDYANWKFHDQVPLENAMTFMAKLQTKSNRT